MNSNFEDFEPMFFDLTLKVREKALELAQQLLVDGRFSDKESALREGIKQAEEWFLDLEG